MSNWNFSFAFGYMPVYDSRPLNSYVKQSPVYWLTDNQYNNRYYASSTSNINYCSYNTSSDGYFHVLMFSDSNVAFYNSQSSSSDSSNASMSYTSSQYNNIYYNDTPYNISSYTLVENTLPYIGTFTSTNDALDYVIANGISYGNETEPVKYPYTFQNGYLFVYDLGNTDTLYSFDLTSKSEEYSNIGDNPFPDTNQTYWFDNSLPETDETTIPSSSAITIQWQKGDKTNIFGQTQDMKSTISGTSTGRYLYIYNPPAHYKWSGSSNPTASETVNYPVTVNGLSSGDNFYLYDSRAILFDFNQGGKVQGTVTGETGYGSVSSDGAISVVTSEGTLFTQNSGGSTDISGANGGSIAENINGLKETLDSFVNQFIQLLSAPISHIQQLIQSGSSFFEVFSGLFEWLPSEVSAIIVSGLIIMIVVGVLKMLL